MPQSSEYLCRYIPTFLFHPFELEARLFHGLADIVLARGARDHKRVGGRGGLAGLNAFQLLPTDCSTAALQWLQCIPSTA